MRPSRWVKGRAGPGAGTAIALASRLPLRGYRDIPGFLRDTRTVRGQLREAPGLAGYSLRAQLLRKTFWTLSLGESAPDLARFAAGAGIAAARRAWPTAPERRSSCDGRTNPKTDR